MKPDEICERYGQHRDQVSVVVTKSAFNTYLHIEDVYNGKWVYRAGSARGLGDRPYQALVESLLAEEQAKKKVKK